MSKPKKKLTSMLFFRFRNFFQIKFSEFHQSKKIRKYLLEISNFSWPIVIIIFFYQGLLINVFVQVLRMVLILRYSLVVKQIQFKQAQQIAL